VVYINGHRHNLGHARTVIGRGSEADITVDDNGISRRHVEIAWDGHRGEARDLGSTNGSKLNGEPLSRSVLEPGDVITAGRTRIVFNVVPRSGGHR
jgi:pSer/pThr/pTyr-binding forkhead associated (FHA) protein